MSAEAMTYAALYNPTSALDLNIPINIVSVHASAIPRNPVNINGREKERSCFKSNLGFNVFLRIFFILDFNSRIATTEDISKERTKVKLSVNKDAETEITIIRKTRLSVFSKRYLLKIHFSRSRLFPTTRNC